MARRVTPVRVHMPAQPSTYRTRANFAEAPPAARSNVPSFWQMVAVGVTVSVISSVIISRFNLR